MLERRFSEFPPKEAIALLLSFVYIERFPLNFVSKLFNPYFLDRLHSQADPADVAAARANLKLFDSTMRMEARGYGGPFLPKDTAARAIPRDGQVERLAHALVAPLRDIVECKSDHATSSSSRVAASVVLSSLPLHPLYVADLLVYPTSVAAAVQARLGLRTRNDGAVVVILHPDEHYTYSYGNSVASNADASDSDPKDRHLVGAQSMRLRHLRAMGFRLLELECRQVARMQMTPSKLREMLAEKYAQAMDIR